MTRILRVALDVPARSEVGDGVYDYLCDREIAVGTLVVVPLGTRSVVGIVIGSADEATVATDRLRPITAVVEGVSPLSADWIALVRFAARYYHRSFGEVALPTLPAPLRDAHRYLVEDGIARLPAIGRAAKRDAKERAAATPRDDATDPVALNARQTAALAALRAAADEDDAHRPTLLYGITGSGKTEV